MSLLYSRIAESRRDADADAYILLVQAAGGTVTAAQRDSINDFIRGEKISTRWDSIKRFYFPIWGVAAANAICMRSLTSGTFVGGVTHSSGFVTFDGTTGYFSDNATCITHGMTVATAHVMALIYNNPATAAQGARHYGAYDSGDATKEITAVSNTALVMQSRVYGTATQIGISSYVLALREGVMLTNRNDTTAHHFKLMKTAGLAQDRLSSVTNTATPPASKMGWAARISQTDAAANFYPADYGAMSVGVSIGDSTLQNTYLSRVKTLFETCTGLTLP